MNIKWNVVNKNTKEEYQLDTKTSYLVMSTSGIVAEVILDYYTFIEPLNMDEWEVVFN